MNITLVPVGTGKKLDIATGKLEFVAAVLLCLLRSFEPKHILPIMVSYVGTFLALSVAFSVSIYNKSDLDPSWVLPKCVTRNQDTVPKNIFFT